MNCGMLYQLAKTCFFFVCFFERERLVKDMMEQNAIQVKVANNEKAELIVIVFIVYSNT